MIQRTVELMINNNQSVWTASYVKNEVNSCYGVSMTDLEVRNVLK